MRTTLRFLVCLSLVLLAGVASALGYRLVRADVRASLYEERIAQLAADFDGLREHYNAAVRKTAITELYVNRGTLCVRVRTAEGVVRTIDTPFDPTGEVYVDYVVQGGRVWIRRVFDERTAPADAVVIDPAIDGVDWADPNAKVGKAVYRALDEGRWIVTVTGDGALGLARAGDESERSELTQAPEVRDFEELDRQVDRELRQTTLRDIWVALVGE